MYADETGDLDMSGTEGSSTYFGVGTATYIGEHAQALGEGFALRLEMEKAGLNLPKGFHAVNDTRHTRSEVYAAIKSQEPRFDTTFLKKSQAGDSLITEGPTGLYQLAWRLHFEEIAPQVASPGDRLWVIAATLQTNKRKALVREALEEVVSQGPSDREITLCVWDSATSWGLQVADYGLWAVQRQVERGTCQWWDCVQPTLSTMSFPWGK